jgi:hypothetical protein
MPYTVRDDLLLNTAEIALYLGVNFEEIETHIDKLPVFWMAGDWRARKSTLIAFIEQREAEAFRY